RQKEQRSNEQSNVHNALRPGTQRADAVSVKIPAQQHNLEKQKANGPNRRTAAKPRQNIFADQRLNLDEQERAQKNVQRKTDQTLGVNGGGVRDSIRRGGHAEGLV